MSSLIDRIKGTETLDDDEDRPGIDEQVPDTIPYDWSGLAPDDPPGAEPAPAPATKPKTFKLPPVTGPAVGPAMRKRISGELQVYGLLLVMPWEIRDPVCGRAARETVPATADAIADILAYYPDLAAKFIASGVIGAWMKLAMTLRGLAEVVYHHHIARDHPSLTEDQGADDDLSAYPTLSEYRDRPGR